MLNPVRETLLGYSHKETFGDLDEYNFHEVMGAEV